MALPAENAEIQTAIARARCPGPGTCVKISDSVEGASVAPAMPSSARLTISISELVENAASSEIAPNAAAPIEQQLAAADPVAERAHRDEEARDHEPVDVDDPQQLRAARLEVLADRRDRQVQHRQVHHVEQAREGEDGETDPFAAAGHSDLWVGHLIVLLWWCTTVRPKRPQKLIAGRTDEFRPPVLSYPVAPADRFVGASVPIRGDQKGPPPWPRHRCRDDGHRPADRSNSATRSC